MHNMHYIYIYMRTPTLVVENAYILCMDASTCTTRLATLGEYYGYSSPTSS